jgi:hypothetical protein
MNKLFPYIVDMIFIDGVSLFLWEDCASIDDATDRGFVLDGIPDLALRLGVV